MPRFGFPNGIGECGHGMTPSRMTLWGLEQEITCPLLNLSSTGEGKAMYDNARSFFEPSRTL